MERISDKKKSMASLAVFRELYNQRKDVYYVISEFIKLAIDEKHIYSFELQQMCTIISDMFGFDLPMAVVKTSLKRITSLKKDGTQYFLNSHNALIDASVIREKDREEKEETDTMAEQLFSFASKDNQLLSDDKKEELYSDFCAFVLDDNATINNREIVAEFIYRNENDKSFLSQLEQIREGLIIYVGLCYNSGSNNVDELDKPLNIYLDTEILFHMFGLHGSLYQSIFDEFYGLVQEVNKASKTKHIINLRYFEETESEICAFFRAAESIVRKERQLDPSRMAMINLINGCCDASEVAEKKTKFFAELKAKDITLDKQNQYYDSEINYKYVIECKKFYNLINDEIRQSDIDRKTRLLNYISIKRGYKAQEIFRNIGHIFLSANRLVFKIAFDSDVRQPGTVPLATDLSFLTNRLWFILHKGFAEEISLPKAASITSKAKIALSSALGEAAAKFYKQFDEEDKRGQYNEHERNKYLATIRSMQVPPEDLDTVKDIDYVSIISNDDIHRFIAERDMIQKRLEEDKSRLSKENVDIRVNMNQKQEQLNKAVVTLMNSENSKLQNDFNNMLIKYDEEKNSWVDKQYSKYRKENSRMFILYCFAIVLLFIMTSLFAPAKIDTLWLEIIVYLSELVVFAIPFFGMHIKSNRLTNSIRFVLCKVERNAIKTELEEKYKSDNPIPVLTLKTEEDILKSLE